MVEGGRRDRDKQGARFGELVVRRAACLKGVSWLRGSRDAAMAQQVVQRVRQLGPARDPCCALTWKDWTQR